MMEQSRDLDEALKLLNGLESDPTKRANIVEYVREKGTIAVFAYASLIWNPFEHVEQIIPNCVLTGYTKGFFCQDFIYRGTMDCMGLTMGLKPCENGFVKGYMLMSGIQRLIQFINAFIQRETPIDFDGTKMDIYTYDFLPVIMPDGKTIEWALTCVVNCDSHFCLPIVHSIEQQAKIIGRCYGINGTNLQYLQNTMNTYRQLDLLDTFTEELEQLHVAVLLYRQHLDTHDRQWLDRFDQLTTKDERRLEMESRKTSNVEKRPRKLFNRMFSTGHTLTLKYHRMLSV
jgi:cation transport regulator ChaC